MKKNILILISILIPELLFAGNGGGTMAAAKLTSLLNGGSGGGDILSAVFNDGGSVGTLKIKELKNQLAQLNAKKVVYQIQSNAVVTQFALGVAIDKEWKFQKINVENVSDDEIFNVLRKSNELNDWVELK